MIDEKIPAQDLAMTREQKIVFHAAMRWERSWDRGTQPSEIGECEDALLKACAAARKAARKKGK